MARSNRDPIREHRPQEDAMLPGHEPFYTISLPRSVALTCLAALRKQPLEQVELAHSVLAAELQRAEEYLAMKAIEEKALREKAYREAAAGPG